MIDISVDITKACLLILLLIAENEMQTEIHMLKHNKSPGYDGVSWTVIKVIEKEISKPLTHIFNLTFITGLIPDQLKIALVTPIFKTSADTKTIDQYRFLHVFQNY